MTDAAVTTPAPKADDTRPPSLAFECPQCHFDAPQEEVGNNPSTDRWFSCPKCGHKWTVTPIADHA